jgi:hypothetical protein
VVEGVEKNPTFAAYIDRAGHEYAASVQFDWSAHILLI